MSSSKNFTLLLVVVVGLAAWGLGFAMSSWRPKEDPSPAQQLDWEEMLRLLASIDRKLDRSPRFEPPPSESDAAPGPASEEPQRRERIDLPETRALIASLDRLQQSLQRLEQNLGTQARRNASIYSAIHEQTEPNYQAIQDFIQKWELNQDEAIQSLQFMTIQEVLIRFGKPTEINRYQASYRWNQGAGLENFEVYFHEDSVNGASYFLSD